jgi:hypothetical protein
LTLPNPGVRPACSTAGSHPLSLSAPRIAAVAWGSSWAADVNKGESAANLSRIFGV